MSFLSSLLSNRKASGSMSMSAKSTELQPGNVVADRYKLLEPLGQGAMGKVFRAEDKVLGVSVALKVLSQNLVSKELVQQFSREAQIGAFLGNQNIHIVRVLDYGLHNDVVPFYAMEFVYGATLDQEITLQPLAVPRFLRLMQQVCAGLQSAHQGVMVDGKLCCVVHRDIKPSNIFITHNSSLGELAKVLDFGIADFFHAANGPTDQKAMGTLAYSSAEQLQGLALDPRADIYSLGVTMFEVLTGELPLYPASDTVPAWVTAHCHHPPRTIQEAAPDLKVPDALEDLIQACLEKDLENRPQTVEDVMAELKAIEQSVQNGTASFSNGLSSKDILDELFDEAEHEARPKPPSNTQTLILGDVARTTATPSEKSEVEGRDNHALFMAAWQSKWPADKPNAEIVFSKTFNHNNDSIASLWVMLSHAEVQFNHLPNNTIEFMFERDPYPMMGWVTTLFNEQGNMRCLPCFLDLKATHQQQIISQLVEQGEFLFILFDIGAPEQPVQVTSLQINQAQRQLLTEQLALAKNQHNLGAKSVSKLKLKDQYQALKVDLRDKLKRQKAIAL